MKNLFFILLFSFEIFSINAQNLVPNWSFEDTIKCVDTWDEFDGYVADWTGQWGGGGLSYFTGQCVGAGLANVPSNGDGFQYAHTGVSYCGIYTYVSDTGIQGGPWDSSYYNFRNYIEAKFISPLNTGTKYYITFYVSLANQSEFACSDMGAYLSDSALKFDTGNTKLSRVKDYLTPQIANNPITNPLTDTLNWMKVTGTYIANGGEQYIIIGNFKNDTNSHIKFFGWIGNEGAAYYYIDDVFVTTDSALAGASEVKTKSEEVKVFPNPANTELTVQLSLQKGQTANICLYNTLGQLILCNGLQNSLNILQIDKLSSGLYYYRIVDSNGNLLKADKQVIIH